MGGSWEGYESVDDEDVDLTGRREELRREMCGDKEPSELLSLAIYEAVREDWSATSDDVFEMYLRLAKEADSEADKEERDHDQVAHHAA